MRRSAFIFISMICLLVGTISAAMGELLPIPDKLVVLMFDDGNKSDLYHVAPILKKYGFGGTLYITEAWIDSGFHMSWEEIRQAHDMGLEIANHTSTHPHLPNLSEEELIAELEIIEARCAEYGIPKPVTFAYCAGHSTRENIETIRKKGFLFAKSGVAPEFQPADWGRGPHYDPKIDDPLFMPVTLMPGPDYPWLYEDLAWMVENAKDGKIATFSLHGIHIGGPHPWNTIAPQEFDRYMKFLHDEGCTVIAHRDLAKYVDPSVRPYDDPFGGKEQRFSLTPMKLKCEYSVDLLGLDMAKPRFSWISESVGRGQVQTAYRILVASSMEKLKNGIGDKWDSGKVESDESVNISYDGKALSSGEKCYWRVQIWDRDDKASILPEPATFSMGLLEEKNWQGKWISMPNSRNDTGYIQGRLGKAIELNGTNETVRIGDYSELRPAGEVTISAWVKPGDGINDHEKKAEVWWEIYRKEGGLGPQLMTLGKVGRLEGVWFGIVIDGKYTEDFAALPLKQIKDGKWHLITVSFDGSFKKIYADGKEIGKIEVNGPIYADGSSPAFIGSSSGLNEFFDGGIDDVRVYERALGDKEIKSLAKGRGVKSGLVGHWAMDGDLANSVNGNDGQAEGKIGDSFQKSPLLRKEFNIAGEIKRANAYVSGLGWNEFYINGERIGDKVLDPTTTNYNKRVLYSTYDVTEQLRKGKNVVAMILGNSWYSRGNTTVGPRALLQMNIEYDDGRTESIVTDGSWKSSESQITFNDVCDGEHYDGRLEQAGWNNTGFDDSKWQKVLIAGAPGGKMASQLLGGVKVIQKMPAIRILEPKPDVYVFDFGQHFSGWVRLKAQGSQGSKITLRYAGRIYKDGTLDNRNNLENSRQTDIYTFKGQGTESWEPRFTLHGFRYVEATGFEDKPSLDSLEGHFVRSAIETTGRFECSNPLLNQIHHNSQWTLMTSFQGIPQDAAERYERFGWMGDPGFVAEDYMYNFDDAAFWSKWLNDINDAQLPGGEVPVTVPGEWYACWPAWESSYSLFAWYVYQYYKDERILETHYDGIRKQVEHFSERANDYIMPDEGQGDHMEPQLDNLSSHDPQHTPVALTSTAYYYFDTWILAQAANILGKTDDYQKYSKLAENIKEAFNKEFLNTQTNQYATGSQTSNAMALYLKLVPEDRVDAVLNNLVEDILLKHQGHLSTGIIGTNALEQVLGEYGRADVMYTIAGQTTFPSWGYQVLRGATTVWESFELNEITSVNMKMFCSTEKFFYRDLAGIDMAEPGFKRIIIKPQVVGDLTHVAASVQTPYGLITVDWKKEFGVVYKEVNPKTFDMQVTIPPNTTARIWIPKLGLDNIVLKDRRLTTVWQDGKYVECDTGVFNGPYPRACDGITGATDSDEHIILDAGSGFYLFQMTGQ